MPLCRKIIPRVFIDKYYLSKEEIRCLTTTKNAAVAAVSDCSSGSVVLGIGGPHYNKNFTKLALGNQRAFGHMIPKYVLGEVDAEIITHCFERTLESIDSIVLDWKGIKGEHKSKILAALDGLGVYSEKV